MVQHRKAAPKEMKTLGDESIKSRLEKGLTQRQVAAITNIPRLRLQEIERDKRTPSTEDLKKLVEIAGAQGISLP